ncbi:hypothetical protein JCM12294_47140 [Desulfocicer niacini]
MSSPVNYHYEKFPPDNIEWALLIPLIGPANAALARYDGTLSAVVLLSPLSTQEAVLSSKIEGTQALENQVKAAKILSLYESKKNQMVDLTHSQYSIHALDFIFSRPIFKATDFTGIKEIPTSTAKRILSTLRGNGLFTVLRESSGRMAAIYAFTELINIAEGRDIF